MPLALTTFTRAGILARMSNGTTCLFCQKPIEPGMRFCPICGTDQTKAAAAPAANRYQWTVDAKPSYSIATVKLGANQAIRAESGVMVAMSANVQLTSKMEGGFMGALKRAVTRESMFQSTFTALNAPGEVLFAPALPGDIVGVELAGQSFMVQASSYLAGDPSLAIETKFGGAKSLFSGEGLFFIQVRGSGLVLLSSFGAVIKKTLGPGEQYVVDTGHIVAFEETIRYTLRKASQQGWLRSMVSGEGIVAEYTGPGDLYLQTRNLQAFVGELIPFFPTQGGGGGVSVGGFRIGG